MVKPTHERALEYTAKAGLAGLGVLAILIAMAFVVPGAIPGFTAWVRGTPALANSLSASQPVVVAKAMVPPAPKVLRTLAIIIPGTHGNEAQWPLVIPTQATFGSELRRAAGPGTDVYPFIWYSSISHPERQQAAENLAALIDAKAGEYDRICLIGHSHGGNIALAAAGQCHTKLDLVVCLSTPFVCLKTRAADGTPINLPVYCPPRARENIKTLVTLAPDTDAVPDGWADIDLGLSQNDAIRLTRGWQEKLSFPRLNDDGWFSGSNLTACRTIDCADVPIVMQSYVTGRMGIVPHGSVHSRRMGSVLGELIREGPTPREVGYLAALVQPAGADVGGPILLDQQEKLVAETAAARELIGYRLDFIEVQLTPARQGQSLYFFARIITAGRDGVRLSTPFVHGLKGSWPTHYILPSGGKASLEIVDDGYVWNSSLGMVTLDGSQPPPATASGSNAKWSWTASMQWTAVHY